MNHFTIIVLLLCPFLCLSQDNIIKKDGAEIKAKILQVDADLIKYKRYDNADGPTYTIKKSSVFMIQYENGTKDVFSKEEDPKSKEKDPKSKEKEEKVDNNKKSTNDETEGIKNYMFLNAGIRIGIGESWTNYFSYPGIGADFELGHIFYFAKRKMPKFLGVGLNCTWLNTGGFVLPAIRPMPYTMTAGPQVSFQPAQNILLDVYFKPGVNLTYKNSRVYVSFISELGFAFRHKALLVGFGVAFLRVNFVTNNNFYDYTHLRLRIGVNIQKDYN